MVTPWRWARLALPITVLLGLLVVHPAGTAQGAGTVVASDLANPRGLVLAADGTLYVAEAGLSGSEAFTIPPPYPASTRGTTGRVTKIAPDGTRTTLADHLPSMALGGDASFFVFGPAGLALVGDTLWVATGAMVNGAPAAPRAATVLRIALPTGAVSVGADVNAYEHEHNPDGYETTSDPYGLTRAADGSLYLTDAGGNTLYRIDPATGQLTVVAVLPGQPGPAANSQRGGKNEVDPVPTGVAPGPDGSLYVGLLTGVPFPAGEAKVVKVTRDGAVSDVVDGLDPVVGLAVGPDQLLYVAEFGSPALTPNSGRVLRVLPQGTTQVVAEGLNFPNGLAFDAAGNLYLSVNSASAPEAGPQGQVLRFDGVAVPAPPPTLPPPPVQVPAAQVPR